VRVLILHSRYLSGPVSGENQVVLDEARLLSEGGHHVRVWSPSPEVGSEYQTKAEDGSLQLDLDKFFAENLEYAENQFDAILCWDAPDYLPESLVKPLVGRIHTMLKPGGVLLAFFHTQDTGPESPHYRYDITQPDTLQMESRSSSRMERIFNNRHIENLFKDFASKRFFLGRDNLREVIVVR